MKKSSAFILAIALVPACLGKSVTVRAQEVVSPDEISRALVIRNLEVGEDGSASGVLVNKSTLPLAEVRLLITHAFLWKKERAPRAEADNPARALYYDVPGTVPAAGVVAFRYTPDPPLPARPDGRFQTTVDVVGFVEATAEGQFEEAQPEEAPNE